MLSLEKRAKDIAQYMHNNELKFWHIKGELEIRKIPFYARDKLEKLVIEELNKIQSQ